MRICICGGGSLGHVCAGVLASQEDIILNMYSGHPDRWEKTITITDPNGKHFKATLNRISNKPEEVIANQDFVLLCVPGYLIERTLTDIKPFIGNAIIGSIVSSTGFFFFAHDILGGNAPLFGFQRVPFIARVTEYGKSASLLGYKSSISIVVENVTDREGFRAKIEKIFTTPTRLLDNFYEVSLSNSNPILHTARLYSMFRGRQNDVFDHNILFYKEWTDDASQLLIEMDAEFFTLLDKLNVTTIPPLLDYYESSDASSLTRKIRSISAFQSIESPMVKGPDGWRVDFSSRYFIEDFPYGLRWVKELAHHNNVLVPTIDEVYSWGMSCIM